MQNIRLAVLHGGPWKSVFGERPKHIAQELGLSVTDNDQSLDLAYLLAWDEANPPTCECFIPFEILLALKDKRKQTQFFQTAGVPIPESHLLPDWEAVQAFYQQRNESEWILKWPVGDGGIGHQMLNAETQITSFWQPPFLVQAKIKLPCAEVYRFYCIDNHYFGWLRRFVPDQSQSEAPWVAHCTGAELEMQHEIPPEALAVGRQAFEAVGLNHYVGAVDLLQNPEGQWLVLELNSEGIYHYLDRYTQFPEFSQNFAEHLKRAFTKRALALERSSQ